MPWKAKLVTVTYPTTNHQQAVNFYGTLLGVQLARTLTDAAVSHHSLVSAGVHLELSAKQGNWQNAICHFAVSDLNAAIQDLTQQGGTVLRGPFDMPISPKAQNDFKANYGKHTGKDPAQVTQTLGTGVIMRDPDGNLVGLLQLESFAHVMFQKGDLSNQDEAEHQAAVATGKNLGG